MAHNPAVPSTAFQAFVPAWLRREALTIAAVLMLVAVTVGGVAFFRDASRTDNPALFGNDYLAFYSAGRLALEGRPEAAYDRAAHIAIQQKIVAEAKGGGRLAATYYFGYPPTYLTLVTPFALLPYFPSLFLFLGLTATLYVAAMWLIWPGWRTILFAVAVPNAAIAFGFGQNGFLTAGLVGIALVLLDRRPVLSGILIGCLAFKPQLGLAFPVILAGTMRWRAFAAAAAAAAAIAAATLVWPGADTWHAFLDLAGMSRNQLLETSGVGFDLIQSVFATLRGNGVAIDAAYATQATFALAVAAILVGLWRSGADYRLKAAAAAVATLLMTPFCLPYDLLIEVPAAALFLAYGAERGFRPGELALIAAALLTPQVAALGLAGPLPVGLAGMIVMFGVIVLRARTDMRGYRGEVPAHAGP
ncbi:MAG TPA: glycosyltransferase family 87 protein [Bauldia sp.]|nr:glycosyltransferase family 87 protein [Bauldia sp.]